MIFRISCFESSSGRPASASSSVLLPDEGLHHFVCCRVQLLVGQVVDVSFAEYIGLKSAEAASGHVKSVLSALVEYDVEIIAQGITVRFKDF